MPVSLMFAVATATTGLALVTEIDSGYFDKLLVAPIRRTSLILGRLSADLVRGIAASAIVLLVGIVIFGAHVRVGVLRAPSWSSCSPRSSESPTPASGFWSRSPPATCRRPTPASCSSSHCSS